MQKESLTKELENLLDFWLNMVLTDDKNDIHNEVSIKGKANTKADTGSMYLARIIYGASIACKTLKTDKYKKLADVAYQSLVTELKNQKGGFYWAKNKNGEIVHDAENINMAQAFVLYGLAEYASLNKHAEIELIHQSKFIIETLIDKENSGFIDGFNANWELTETKTKALGTHVHLLEAFTKQYEYNNNPRLIPVIEYLITIIIDKFFVSKTKEFIHRTEPNWTHLANENWAGHNAEVSWILCKSATIIKSEILIEKCNALAVEIMDKVIETAVDRRLNGVFNVIENNRPTENVKIWWPQAETTIGLLNVYQITQEQNYLNQAKNIGNYISSNFIHESGEWYTELNHDNSPVFSQPLVFFWKSMYHTVRYYVEVLERLK